MLSIWVILLDTSGSMSDGFSSKQSYAHNPLAEHDSWNTKLDAAKDLLLKQVNTIRVQDIAVFQFTNECYKLFQGTRNNLLSQPTLITSLHASGGTSIANAINEVEKDSSFEKYQSLNVLIISDGLSDFDEAVKSAKSLVIKFPYARIDTILIDDIEDGRKVAEGISINGTVRPVSSSIQLGQAINSARADALRSNLANMAQLRLQTQQELLIPNPTLISVTSEQSLNAATLKNDIAPTLAGIEALGYAKSYALGSEYQGVISSISQDSPISINLTGLKESVELALTYVIPWRRKNAERIAMLDIQNKEIEVEGERHKNSLYCYDAEQRRLELLRIELELANSKLELTERMLKIIDPNLQLQGEAREQALGRLLSGVNQLSSTNLEFVMLGDKIN